MIIKKKKSSILYLVFSILICCLNCTDSKNQKDEHSKFEEKKRIYYSSLDSLSIERTASVDSMNLYALRLWEDGDYQRSLNLVNLAYDKAVTQKNDTALAKVLNTLGLVQWRLGNNEDAMHSYSESGVLAEQLKLDRLVGLTYTNKSLILKEQQDYEMALALNYYAMKLFEQNHFYRELGIAYNNHGQIYKNKGVNDSARIYYEKALKSYNEAEYADGKAATYYNLSEIYSREGKMIPSLEAAKLSLGISKSIQRKLRISEAYLRIFSIYEQFKMPDSALKYFKLYHELNEEILLTNQSENLAKQQVEMGTKVKNLQILNLQKDKELMLNRILFISIASFMIFLLIFAIIYRAWSKIRFKKKQLLIELESSKSIIHVQEQELKSYILNLSQKNNTISKLQKEFKNKDETASKDLRVVQLLGQKILTDDDWETFKLKFKKIYPEFFSRVKSFKTDFTEGEVRFIVLMHLGLSSKEMAGTLGISPQSVRVNKMRLKRKLKNDGFNSVEEIIPNLLN